MVYFLNNGLILEQEIVQALKRYLAACGADRYYQNYTINVTNQHPFARLALDAASGVQSKTSLFPAIIVAAESDGKPDGLENCVDVSGVVLTIEDVTPAEGGGASPLEQKGYMMMMTAAQIADIREAIEQNGQVYGQSYMIRRSDHIAIEIWAENIQLKNELYELIRLFVCGFMKDSLEKTHEEEHGLTIFDHTVHGQRSNTFNVDFGIDLAGALITFNCDYIIEQTVIDTGITGVEANGSINGMEVINHVKEQSGTTRSVIFDDSYTGAGGACGAD
jgi:hypothetical protein